MNKKSKSQYTPGQGWNDIFKKPKEYNYYDLLLPHQDIKKVLNFFTQRNAKKVLDLGSGLGNNLFYLNKAGFDMYGIDASDTAVTETQKKINSLRLNINVRLGSFESLPYSDKFFDAVVSVQTLNHGYEKNIVAGISEIERILKPGGLIFVTLPGRISQGKVRYCLVKTAKKAEDNTYIPTIGDETGVPHVIYNKKLLKKHYTNFNFLDLWKDDKDYYCLIAELAP